MWLACVIHILLSLSLFFFFGHAGSSLLPGFSLVVESGGYSLVGVQACCKEQTQEHLDFRSCGMWAHQLQIPGSGAQAQLLWHTGLVAPGPVGSSWTRNQTCVSCIGRQILYHWATREALSSFFFFFLISFYWLTFFIFILFWSTVD